MSATTPPAQAIIEAICADKQRLSIKSIRVSTYQGEMEVVVTSKDSDVVLRLLRVLEELGARDNRPLDYIHLDLINVGYRSKS